MPPSAPPSPRALEELDAPEVLREQYGAWVRECSLHRPGSPLRAYYERRIDALLRLASRLRDLEALRAELAARSDGEYEYGDFVPLIERARALEPK